MIAIDTNLIVRYLTGDHPEQSLRARSLIDGRPVFAAVTVILEVEWVLCSTYGFRPAEVAGAQSRDEIPNDRPDCPSAVGA